MNEKIVIFDFDGVFTSNFDFHKKHIEKFLDQKILDEDFYDLHSGNVYDDDGKGLELERFDVSGYCNFIKEEFKKLSLVSGMSQVISRMREYGKLYIVTSSCEFNVRNFLMKHKFDVEDFSIYGVETNPSKKIKFERIIAETGISPEDMVFITDTLGDMNEATEMNIASIGVTWGFHRIDTLEQGAPFGFAYEAMDIIKLVNAYFDAE